MIDSSDMAFEEIVLGKEERYLLKKLSYKVAIEYSSDDSCFDAVSRLKRLGLVETQAKKCDFSTGKIESYAIITDRGKDLLEYYNGKDLDRKKHYSHEWKIAIFTVLGGALLSRPLWSGIDWIMSHFFN